MGRKDLLEPLSKREKQVFMKILDGVRNEQIVEDLQISYRTIKNYRTTISKKLQVDNITQAVVKVAKSGYYSKLPANQDLLPRGSS